MAVSQPPRRLQFPTVTRSKAENRDMRKSEELKDDLVNDQQDLPLKSVYIPVCAPQVSGYKDPKSGVMLSLQVAVQLPYL